jgi:hypothetical protein
MVCSGLFRQADQIRKYPETGESKEVDDMAHKVRRWDAADTAQQDRSIQSYPENYVKIAAHPFACRATCIRLSRVIRIKATAIEKATETSSTTPSAEATDSDGTS